MRYLLEWLALAAMLTGAAAATVWMAGALYYDLCRAAKWGRLVALAWLIGVLAMFVAWQPVWQPTLVLLAILAVFLTWWMRQKASHDREWDLSVAVLPRAIQAGDTVTFENLRNFDYRSLDDFTPRYESRTVHLSSLQGVDVIFFNWGSPWMTHPVVVFDFGPEGRVCMSIEVRYRKGQDFAMVRSFFRQQELIFVAADERDVILRRTKYSRNQEAYLYRMQVPAEEVRSAFLDYVGAINSLCDTPRWYHGLCANCTTTFYRLPNRRWRWDWRVVVNGSLDRALYEAGRFDRTVPFDELKQMANLNAIANSAPEDGFGDHIRRELERRRHERGHPERGNPAAAESA